MYRGQSLSASFSVARRLFSSIVASLLSDCPHVKQLYAYGFVIYITCIQSLNIHRMTFVCPLPFLLALHTSVQKNLSALG